MKEFGHPLYRQGLLIGLPEQRSLCVQSHALHLSLSLCQDVTLRFPEPASVPASLRAVDKGSGKVQPPKSTKTPNPPPK